MKKIIFFLLIFLSAFFVKAEFGAYRKAGVSCGEGQNALDCIVASIKDGTMGKKLNCSEMYFLEQVAFSYNKQAGTHFIAEDARKAFIDGQFFITEWDRNDLMNSGLENGIAHYFPMTGNGTVKVISSKDLNGRTLPIVKAEGTNSKEACFNVCYSKSMQPYKEEKQLITKPTPPSAINLPAPTTVAINLPTPTQYQSEEIYRVGSSENRVYNAPDLTISGHIPANVVNAYVSTGWGCSNCGSTNQGEQPIGSDLPAGNGHAVDANPGWGTTTGDHPIEAEPVWGGTTTGGGPISADPGWDGYATTTNSPVNNTGNTGNGNTGGSGTNGRPIE